MMMTMMSVVPYEGSEPMKAPGNSVVEELKSTAIRAKGESVNTLTH
jgi:hypothetical protein